MQKHKAIPKYLDNNTATKVIGVPTVSRDYNFRVLWQVPVITIIITVCDSFLWLQLKYCDSFLWIQ